MWSQSVHFSMNIITIYDKIDDRFLYHKGISRRQCKKAKNLTAISHLTNGIYLIKAYDDITPHNGKYSNFDDDLEWFEVRGIDVLDMSDDEYLMAMMELMP